MPKYNDPNTGKDFYLYPFGVYDDETSDIRNSKVGFTTIDDTGKVASPRIIAEGSLCQYGEACYSREDTNPAKNRKA